MSLITVEDRVLIKALRIEKGWAVNNMIAEFPAKPWKQPTLYYLVRRMILPILLLILFSNSSLASSKTKNI